MCAWMEGGIEVLCDGSWWLEGMHVHDDNDNDDNDDEVTQRRRWRTRR